MQAQAAAAGKVVDVFPRLCEGAFEAVVAEGLRDLMERTDVIVLAQASMARVVESLGEADRKVPVLSSPLLGMDELEKWVKSTSM